MFDPTRESLNGHTVIVNSLSVIFTGVPVVPLPSNVATYPIALMTWHEKLAYQRKKMGMSQQDVADKLGMAQASYSAYERGVSYPSLKTAWDLSRLLELSLDWLGDPDPTLTLERHRQIQEAIRRLGPETAYARLAKFPEPVAAPEPTPPSQEVLQSAGHTDRKPPSAQDTQGQDQRADAPRVPRRTR